MLSSLLTVLILSYPVGPTTRHRVGPIAFELPVSWRAANRNGDVQFDSPEGGTYMILNVSPVERQGLNAQGCIDIVLQRLAAGPSWKMRHWGAFEGAYELSFARTANAPTSVRVDRLVGCDGEVAWSMAFFSQTTDPLFVGAVVDRVQSSIRRSKVDPNSPEGLLLNDKSRATSESP